MAYSLASLFHLSPKASQFVPNLFTFILPTLHQDKTFVMSLYIRTGQTEHRLSMEKSGKGPTEDIEKIQTNAEATNHPVCLEIRKGTAFKKKV